MSRSGYSDDIDGWELIRWRGAVKSAIRGKRGQEFLRTLLQALDALPVKRLIDKELEADGEVCALGSVGRLRNIDMSTLDPEDYDGLAQTFNIAPCLVREIEYMNDEYLYYRQASPEKRYEAVRSWVIGELRSFTD
jgi:hypothetical protein